MLRSTRLVVAALLVMATALSITPAFAAPSGWQSVDVTLQTEQQQSMLLVSGELSPTAKLPQEAELAVPAGTQLQWIGEVLGGAPSEDPALQYTKSTEQGMDIYRFTLTKARIAQVEGVVQGMGGSDGANSTAALKWTAWQSVPEVRISQRLPQGTTIAQAAPGATLQPGDAGYSYYTKTVKAPKAGDVIDLTFTYALPAAGAPVGGGASTGPSSGSAPTIIVFSLAVAAFGFFIYRVRLKMRAKARIHTGAQAKSSRTAAAKSSKQPHRKGRTHAEQAAPQPVRRVKPLVPTLAIVGIVLVGFLIVGNQGISAKVVDGKITKSFGAASPCTSASIPVMAKQGVDLASQGEKLVDAFTGHEGVGDVTLDIARSTVDITFCKSSQTEDAIRQILAGTDLVDLGAAPVASAPTTATVDPSGDKQTASVDTAGGSFSPGTLLLKAGVPTEIAFGGATSCMTEVIFSELGVQQDLTAGPATVKLPALEPGTYGYACAMGHQTGEVVVQ